MVRDVAPVVISNQFMLCAEADFGNVNTQGQVRRNHANLSVTRPMCRHVHGIAICNHRALVPM